MKRKTHFRDNYLLVFNFHVHQIRRRNRVLLSFLFGVGTLKHWTKRKENRRERERDMRMTHLIKGRKNRCRMKWKRYIIMMKKWERGRRKWEQTRATSFFLFLFWERGRRWGSTTYILLVSRDVNPCFFFFFFLQRF